MDITILRKAGAEFVGTFILIFAATAGPIINHKYDGVETLLGNAACSGLGVMIAILSVGHISGAHLNPAVTLAFAGLKYLPPVLVPVYIVAQLLGSLAASFMLKVAYGHSYVSGGLTVPSVSSGQAFMLEFIATFFLMFVITAVATDTRAVGELAGIAVGATLMLDILLVGPATGGSINPVRTLGPAIAAGRWYNQIWIYIIAPIAGAVTGAGVYSLIKLKETKEDLLSPAQQQTTVFSRSQA